MKTLLAWLVRLRTGKPGGEMNEHLLINSPAEHLSIVEGWESNVAAMTAALASFSEPPPVDQGGESSPDDLDVATLEARLRPGAWSTVGFLGATESLTTILAQDAQTLSEAGVTYQQLADALDHILEAAREDRARRLGSYRRRESCDSPNEGRGLLRRLEAYDRDNKLDSHDEGDGFLRREPLPERFALDRLPDPNIGYRMKNFHLLRILYRGRQQCPWGCQDTSGSFDFVLINRDTGEYVSGPGLIAHLIREHHFFEGAESPYRVDPVQLMRVLGLHP